jgi:hypothetical protein
VQSPLLVPSQSPRLDEQTLDHARSLIPLCTNAGLKEARACRRPRTMSGNDVGDHQRKFIATGHWDIPGIATESARNVAQSYQEGKQALPRLGRYVG